MENEELSVEERIDFLVAEVAKLINHEPIVVVPTPPAELNLMKARRQ